MGAFFDKLAETFAWMTWTVPVAIFFACIVLMLAGMTVWQLRSPSIERKGWLPIPTTRGDRLFIGLLFAAYLNLAWAGTTDLSQGYAAGIALVWLLIVMRWG